MSQDNNSIIDDNCRVFIHIGYPRTATTFLQNVVFPSIPNIIYYNKFMPLKMYTRTGNIQYKREVLDNLAFRKSGQKPVFFSDEGLIASGPIFQLYNIKNIFPNAHIIVTVRSQIDQIISRYRQMVKRGAECHSLDHYFSGRRKYRIISFLSYYSLLDFIEKIFGDNWSVFLFEEYVKDFHGFANQLARIIHSDNWHDSMNISELPPDQSKNASVNSTFPLLRLLNYFGLIRRSRIGSRAAYAIVKSGTFLDNRLSKKHHINRKKKDKKLLIEKSQGAFCKQNEELSKLLMRKLPNEYYIKD